MSIRTVCRSVTIFERSRIWIPSLRTLKPALTPGRRWCSSPGICWKCGVSSNSHMFCKHCKALQRPHKNVNYFNLFGISPSYDLETNSLTKQYRQLQNVLHPDKYANFSENEQNISEEYSTIINKAYSTLQEPLARGLYLLELQGIYLEEENVQSNPSFLMEIMERNEEVDQAASEMEVRIVSEKNKKMLEKLIRQASRAFKSGDLMEAKEVLIKMKYFSSIEAKIKVLKIKMGCID